MKKTALILVLVTSVLPAETLAADRAPDDLPQTASNFTAARKNFYQKVYADPRVSFTAAAGTMSDAALT